MDGSHLSVAENAVAPGADAAGGATSAARDSARAESRLEKKVLEDRALVPSGPDALTRIISFGHALRTVSEYLDERLFDGPPEPILRMMNGAFDRLAARRPGFGPEEFTLLVMSNLLAQCPDPEEQARLRRGAAAYILRAAPKLPEAYAQIVEDARRLVARTRGRAEPEGAGILSAHLAAAAARQAAEAGETLQSAVETPSPSASQSEPEAPLRLTRRTSPAPRKSRADLMAERPAPQRNATHAPLQTPRERAAIAMADPGDMPERPPERPYARDPAALRRDPMIIHAPSPMRGTVLSVIALVTLAVLLVVAAIDPQLGAVVEATATGD